MKKSKNALNMLVIPDMLPYPPNDGGKLCVFGLIDYLRKFHNIQMLLYVINIEDRKNVSALKEKWPEVKIHPVEIFKDEVKLKNSSATTLKKKIKGLFRRIKKSLKKPKPIPKTDDSYADNHSTPFNPHHVFFIQKLTSILAENKFDIIQTEATHMLNLVNLFPADVKKVFVQIEGRGEILYDFGVTSNFDLNYVKHVAGNAKFLEYAFMKQYDAVLALNENDRTEISKNVAPNTTVYTSPFGILDEEIKKPDTDTYKAENLIFIGSENHYPNYDALYWFLTDVITEFKNLPFKKLYVTGNWSDYTKKKLTLLLEHLEFIGFVDDLAPYLKNSISIVPIRIGGGGIRTKILSSMAQGVPVVATPISAVGIKGKNKEELLIADTAKDFADAVCSLFDSRELARKIGRNAHQLIVNHYSQSTVGAIRNDIYSKVMVQSNSSQL